MVYYSHAINIPVIPLTALRLLCHLRNLLSPPVSGDNTYTAALFSLLLFTRFGYLMSILSKRKVDVMLSRDNCLVVRICLTHWFNIWRRQYSL